MKKETYFKPLDNVSIKNAHRENSRKSPEIDEGINRCFPHLDPFHSLKKPLLEDLMISDLFRLRLFCNLVLLSAALLFGAYSWGQSPDESGNANDKVSLQVGDKAPKLQVDHWLGGEPVESFSK